MLYSNLIFIYVILPLSVLVTFLDRSTEYKNLILVITSVVFFSFGKPLIVLLLFATIIFDFLFGLLAGSKKSKALRMLGLFLAVVVNVGIFVWLCWNTLFYSTEKLHLAASLIPMGTAFYTIKGLSYVGDVYFDRIKSEKNIFCLLVYMVDYHHLIAGPIVRYGDIEKQIRKRTITGQNLNDGFTRFIIGFFKVSLIALACDRISETGLNFFNMTSLSAIIGMIAFILYIYFIFSGYCDMAIGLGLLNGFKYKENFFPIHFSNGVTGLINGFNKTLVDFFRDFLIKPFKHSKVSALCGVIASGMLIGLWYSLSEHMFIAGLYFAFFVCAEAMIIGKVLKSCPKIISYIYTFVVAFVGFTIVRYDNIGEFAGFYRKLFGIGVIDSPSKDFTNELYAYLFLFLTGIIVMIPFIKNGILRVITNFASKSDQNYGIVRISQTIILAIMLIMSTTAIVIK